MMFKLCFPFSIVMLHFFSSQLYNTLALQVYEDELSKESLNALSEIINDIKT